MKKIISVFVLSVLLAGLLAPAISMAQPETLRDSCQVTRNLGMDECTPDASGVCNETSCGEAWGMCCLVNTVYNVTDWIFYLLMIAVVVLVVIGGAMYMMSGGNPETAGKGKTIIIYGIVGLVISLLAKLIPSVVKLIVGMG